MKVYRGTTFYKRSVIEYLLEVYHHRWLILKLTSRDIKVQYAQSVLGIIWAMIQPITGLLIYTFLFDMVIDVTDSIVPYPLFVFTGIINWFYFSSLVSRSGTSLISSVDMIKTTYFPKLVLPIYKAMVGLVEFGIAFLILLLIIVIFQYPIRWQILLTPLFLGLNILTGLSIAIWLSALTVRYRDFHHLIPFLINFGIFLTPVFFPSTLIPDQYSFLLYFNPMAGVIEGFRWCIIGGDFPSLLYLPVWGVVMAIFWLGLYYFNNLEDDIAEFI